MQIVYGSKDVARNLALMRRVGRCWSPPSPPVGEGAATTWKASG